MEYLQETASSWFGDREERELQANLLKKVEYGPNNEVIYHW